jgi:hypothetical protein
MVVSPAVSPRDPAGVAVRTDEPQNHARDQAGGLLARLVELGSTERRELRI